MVVRFFSGGQLRGTGIDPAFDVGSDAAGDHQADAATGALREVRRHAFESARLLFKAGVHGPHQGAVAQRCEPQIQRGQQMRVVSGGHTKLHQASSRRREHSMALVELIRDLNYSPVHDADINQPPGHAQ